VVPTTNDESTIEKVSKSKLLDVDATKSKKFKRSGHKMNKHAKAWVNNAFNQW
jgi:hypothetical protein